MDFLISNVDNVLFLGEEECSGHGCVFYHRCLLILARLQPQNRGQGELRGGLHARRDAHELQLLPTEGDGSDEAEARR